MPIWSAQYRDKNNQVLRSGVIRAATKDEADALIKANALNTDDHIGVCQVPLNDESRFAVGYTAQ